MSLLRVPSTAIPFLQSLVTTNQVKSKLTSMACGRVLSQYATLPPSDNICYRAYFTNTNAELIYQFLDVIYSVAPIDHEKILDYAKKFYAIRCENALGCCKPSMTGSNGIYNLFHVGLHLSEEEIDLIAKNHHVFYSGVVGFEDIYKKMGESLNINKG